MAKDGLVMRIAKKWAIKCVRTTYFQIKHTTECLCQHRFGCFEFRQSSQHLDLGLEKHS